MSEPKSTCSASTSAMPMACSTTRATEGASPVTAPLTSVKP
jgi:hypothetical protein